jgi:hypothetical protein
MRLFYCKEAPGLHAAVRFVDATGPLETVALFKTERDARRFVNAGNRSMSSEQQEAALAHAKVA